MKFTSKGHLCIVSRKYFPIASLDRENSNDIYFMAFVLKGKVLKIVKEKMISTCGRGIRNTVSCALRHELLN